MSSYAVMVKYLINSRSLASVALAGKTVQAEIVHGIFANNGFVGQKLD